MKKSIIIFCFGFLPLFHLSKSSLLWKQKPFTEDKSIKANLDGWNARMSWGLKPKSKSDQMSIVGDALEVFYPKGKTSSPDHGGAGFKAKPVDLSTVGRELTLEYELMFKEGFDFVKGGKLPGLYGGKKSCSGGKNSDQCWSMRYMWRKHGDAEIYAYLPGNQRDGFCDDRDIKCNFKYGHSLGRGAWRFSVGQWHQLKQTITLNNVGSMDGSVTVSLDGKQVYRREGLSIRTLEKVGFEGIMFSTFYGGSNKSWAPKKDTWTYFRNLSLST